MYELMKLYSTDDQLEVKKMLDMGTPGNGKLQLSSFRGYNIMPGFCAESAQYAYEKWDTKNTDVILASFPKSGASWTSGIIKRILYQDKNELAAVLHFPYTFRVLEFGGPKKFELLDKLPLARRFMITHLPGNLVNMDKTNAKVVHVVRNPKDLIVSWYNFAPKMSQGQLESWKTMLNFGWDKYFEHMVSGDFEMHSKPGEWYPEHMLAWYKHRDNKNVHFIYFEDMKKNLQKEIKRLAEFLDVPITDEKVEEIIEDTSIDKMKENLPKIEYKPMQEFLTRNMHKGDVGGWKDYFTVRQSERIDAMMEEKLKDTDIKFTSD